MGRMAPRSSDERILVWLQRLCAGEAGSVIAKEEGVSQQSVSSACNAVLKADEAYEGRSLAEEYW